MANTWELSKVYLPPHTIGLASISLLVREVNVNASRNDVSYVINNTQALVSFSRSTITMGSMH